jgi:FKBP12-rapamycin complex-associated protein
MYLYMCIQVMRVLRDNRDSVMAMLEAFVYDPLISWRLLTRRENETALDSTVPLSRTATGEISTAIL